MIFLRVFGDEVGHKLNELRTLIWMN
jgi:hypothetical protein